MEKPKRRVVEEILYCSLGARHLPVMGIDRDEDWEEEYEDQMEDSDESDRYDMDSLPVINLADIKLPEGVSLSDCYVSIFFDEDHLITRILRDLGPNKNYVKKKKEYDKWLELERMDKEIQRQEQELKWKQENLNRSKQNLEAKRKK